MPITKYKMLKGLLCAVINYYTCHCILFHPIAVLKITEILALILHASLKNI